MNQVEIRKKQIAAIAFIVYFAAIWCLRSVMGDNGLTYYAVSLLINEFIYRIFVGRSAGVIGRLIRGKNGRLQYRNQTKAKSRIFFYMFVFSLLSAVISAVSGYYLMRNAFKLPNGAILCVILSGGFFLRGLTECLLGFFRAENQEMPAVTASVLRVLAALTFGMILCFVLKNYGSKVSALLLNDDFAGVYGALGLSVGIVISELFVFSFCMVIYRTQSRVNINSEGNRPMENILSITRILFAGRLQNIIMEALILLPLFFGLFFYALSSGEEIVTGSMGEYLSLHLFPCLIVFLIIDAVLIGHSRICANRFKTEELKNARIALNALIHFSFMTGIFLSVFLLAFSVNFETAKVLISLGYFLISFMILTDVFAKAVYFSGRSTYVYVGLLIMDAVFIISTIIILKAGKLGVLSLVLSGLIMYFAGTAIFGYMVLRQFSLVPDFIRMFIVPTAISGILGVVVYFAGRLIVPHLGLTLSMLVCFAVTALVYLISLLLSRNFNDSEYYVIPGGAFLDSFARLFGV
ncbi:MAG: hypothetical protein IJ608_08695 [Lachnospiraceae bacterium]|nr:hypothetical protein [Lachnospiraceae bacterium]